MRSFLKVVLIAGSALILYILFEPLIKSSNENQRSNASDQTQHPAFSATLGDTTYYGAVSSYVGVAILNVKSGPGLISFGRFERADGKLIIVAVAIHNGQNTAITMNTGLFKIVDSYGNVYSTSEKSIEVDHDLFLAQINPGITKTGQIVFDVPENLSMDNLWLRFRGGMTGDSATVALKVNSTVMQAPAPPDVVTPQSDNVRPRDQSLRDSSIGGIQPSENLSSNAEGARPYPGDQSSTNLVLMVQIVTVSRQEDADVLVSALRKHGYTASARRDPADNKLHVQIGPFSNQNDAKAMSKKLLHDGYNAIVLSENVNSATSSTAPAQISNQSDVADNAQRVSSSMVTKGQTSAEVLAILGTPDSVTMGAKSVYSYPHLKVVFVDGKVSEIQHF
jgi:cell division septation protein DedD